MGYTIYRASQRTANHNDRTQVIASVLQLSISSLPEKQVDHHQTMEESYEDQSKIIHVDCAGADSHWAHRI
jgi:hypothetical protein